MKNAILVVVFLAIAALLVASIVMYQQQYSYDFVELFKQNAPSAGKPINLTDRPTGKKGTIEGSIIYKTDEVPVEIKICATEVETEGTFCTDQHIADSSYASGVGYKLELDPGEYVVFAQLNNQEYGYYTQYVICGMLPSCSSHELVPVNVFAGETVQAIDPADWLF